MCQSARSDIWSARSDMRMEQLHKQDKQSARSVVGAPALTL